MDATAQALLKVIEYLVFKDLGLGILYAGITYYLVYALVRARSGSPVSVPAVPAQPGGPVVAPPPVVIPPGPGGPGVPTTPPAPAPVVDRFPTAIAFTLDWEGGNDDDPRDPGGRTSRGILQREWDTWRQTHPSLPSDVWQAPQDQVLAIYRQNYWEAMNCDQLPAGVDFAVFDYGVNSGNSRSAKALQKIVGVSVDGEIGPDTIAATSKVDPTTLIGQICEQRLAFLRGLSTWGTFGKGWTSRVQGVRKEALGMVGGVTNPQAPTPVPAPSPSTPAAGAAPWLDTMHSLEGTQWSGGVSNTIAGWMTFVGQKYPNMASYCDAAAKQASSGNYFSWCGATVGYVMAKNGIMPPYDSSEDTGSFLWAEAWLNWGTPVATAQPGDVLIYDFGGGDHHVTLYDHLEPDTDTYASFGGNQSHTVKLNDFKISNCQGIRRPPAPSA